MGNPKMKWTAEEEEALKAGVAKHGAGKWKNIVVDSEFKHILVNRSNVDLKDKWRNMGCNVVQGSRDNAATPKGKATSTGGLPPKTQNTPTPASKDNTNDKPPKSPVVVKNGPKYNDMILEALSSVKDRNGSDFGSIMGFIEKKYEVPENFRRRLSSKLRKLVMQGKIDKVQKRYKMKNASLGTQTPSPKQKAVRPTPQTNSRSSFLAEIVEDAAETAADEIAEAEYKSFIAAEAVEEAERLSRMAEDSDAVVMHLTEILGQCSGFDAMLMLMRERGR